MITIYTTRYNTKEFYVLSKELISEKAVITSLYVSNSMVFITESDSAYCVVRTEILYIHFSLITPKSSLHFSKIYCHFAVQLHNVATSSRSLVSMRKIRSCLTRAAMHLAHAGMAERTKGCRINTSRNSPPFALWLVMVFKQFMKSVTMTKHGTKVSNRDKICGFETLHNVKSDGRYCSMACTHMWLMIFLCNEFIYKNGTNKITHLHYNQILCFVDLYPCIISYIKPTWCTIFLCIFISFHYMIRETMCPSSVEITVSKRNLLIVTLCG